MLDVAVLELDDRPAVGADHVVVVALVDHVVVMRLRAKVPLLSDAGFAQQIQGPVDGRQADVRFVAAQHPVELLDRKSTRLNSSHGYISYAVFCLKKKKNTTR